MKPHDICSVRSRRGFRVRFGAWLSGVCAAGLLAGQAQAAVSSTPNLQVSGRIEYAAMGASFRTTNGNSSTACTFKTPSGGTFTGSSSSAVGQIVAGNATLLDTERNAVQKVPAGATVKTALLYWVASQSTSTMDNLVDLTVGTTRTTVTASRTWSTALQGAYAGGAVADVTNLIRANPNAALRVDNLNVQINGDQCAVNNVHGAWTLYIVYEHAGLSTKTVSFYDGVSLVGGSTGVSTASVNATGFYLPDSSSLDRVAKASVMVADGDPGATGDSFSLNATGAARVSQSSTNRTASDFFRGLVTYEFPDSSDVVQGGSSASTTTTTATNTGGLDIATVDSSAIPAGTTGITATVDSGSSELLILHSLVLEANISGANVRTAKSVVSGMTTATVNTALDFLIKVDNAQGSTEALQVVTVDTLPKGLTYNSTQISYDGGATWATLSGVTASKNSTTGVTTVTFPAIRRLDPDGKVWGGTGTVATQLGSQSVQYRVNVTADGSALNRLTNSVRASSQSSEANSADNASSADINVTTAAQGPLPNTTDWPSTCDLIDWSKANLSSGNNATPLGNGTRTVTSVGGRNISVALTSATGASNNGIMGYSSSFANYGSWYEVRGVSTSIQPSYTQAFLTRAGGNTQVNTVVLTFPQPVNNLRLGISDIDAVGGSNGSNGDWLKVTASYGSATFNPDLLVGGGLGTVAFGGVPSVGSPSAAMTQSAPGLGNSTMKSADATPYQTSAYNTLMGNATSYTQVIGDSGASVNKQGQGLAYFKGPLTSLTVLTGSLKGTGGNAIALSNVSFCAPRYTLSKSAGTPVRQADLSHNIPYSLTYTNTSDPNAYNPDVSVRSTTFSPSVPTPSGQDPWAALRPQISDAVLDRIQANPNVTSARLVGTPSLGSQTNTRNLDSAALNSSFTGTSSNPTLLQANTTARVNTGGSFTVNLTANVTLKSGLSTTQDVQNSASSTGVMSGTTPLTANSNTVVSSLTPTTTLTLQKTASRTFVRYQGSPAAPDTDLLTYTLLVTNTGGVLAQNVVVTDTLPASVTYVPGGEATTPPSSVNGQVLTWNLGSLAPGEQQELTVLVRMPSAQTLETTSSPQPIVNSAASQGENALSVSAQATTNTLYLALLKRVRNLSPVPAAQVTATNPPWGTTSVGHPGDVLEYCIDFHNYGSAALSNYVLQDPLPENVTIEPGSWAVYSGTMTTEPRTPLAGANVSYDAASRKVKAAVNPLPAGTHGTLCFRAKIN
ncbi:DUF11 domain-containing protein [Deinococcus wulumuqiensis]|uniref:DUF11 domain-containing protein n=1 Tax=Deinococcus wulumuqiensis TaxID=980427 RepID=UPI0013C35BDD|nr:DUF11 domain-containing protein [Deinococcus wulumuqiensis]